MENEEACPACRRALIRRSRATLLLVGAGMLGGAAACIYLTPGGWAAGIPLGLTGVYLMSWGSMGRGL